MQYFKQFSFVYFFTRTETISTQLQELSKEKDRLAKIEEQHKHVLQLLKRSQLPTSASERTPEGEGISADFRICTFWFSWGRNLVPRAFWVCAWFRMAGVTSINWQMLLVKRADGIWGGLPLRVRRVNVGRAPRVQALHYCQIIDAILRRAERPRWSKMNSGFTVH